MQAGTRLDHYEIVDLLGEGGMGAVYRAEDTRLKRQVAIKVLPPELAADPERLARLEREAQLLASLNHPNVATVHGFGDVQADVDGREQRVTFLVMELIDGESLYDRAQMGPMPWKDAVEIGIGIASGLEAAHEKGIVHRDLKPANVHVAADGTVKVLDFGLAKAFEGEGSSGSLDLSASPTLAQATRTGVILGTAAYMSPEQARGKPVDKRADIWALGCLLCELLAGHKTFEGETVSDILAAILREKPDFDALPAIPDSLRHVLERCLEKQPAQRMRDVGDVRLELEAARNEPARAPGVSAPSGVSWKIAAALATVAALLGAGGTMTLRGSKAPGPEAHVILSTDAISTGPLPLAISPDGRWIAEVGGGSGLRVRAMEEVSWRQIPGTASVNSVTFSADSRTIYMSRGQDQAGGELLQVGIGGTSPVHVGALPPGFPSVFRGIDGDIFVSTFNGAPYVVSRLEANGSLTQAFAGDTGGNNVLITAQASETRWLGFELIGFSVVGLALVDSEAGTMTSVLPDYRSPLYLGDGRLLASDGDGRLVTLRIDLDDGAVIESPAVQLEGLSLSSGVAGAYGLADDGTFVYLAGPATTEHEEFLSWLAPDGSIEPFSARGTEYQVDTFPSPDGTRVAAEFVSGDDVTVHIHDIARDVSTPLLPGSYSTFPVWSPDSERVAYALGRDEAPGIYSAPVDRSELPRLLLAKPEDQFVLPMDWAPDGSALIYVLSGDEYRSAGSAAITQNDLWLLPLDGSDPRPLVETAAREVDGRFSPDGRWVAYMSDQSGERQIYVRSLAGGGEYQISAQGGYSPEWNPQGGELYFMWQGELYVVDIDVSGATPDVSPERLLVSLRSSRFKGDLYAPWPDGERFLVATHDQGEEARTLRAIFNWELMNDGR